MARPELGNKLVCPECEAKFYDLGKASPVCPKCSVGFQPAKPEPKPRRVVEKAKPAAPEKKAKESTDEVVEADAGATAAGLEVVSLEDADKEVEADADEEDVAAVADLGIEDVEVDDDDDDEDGAKNTFLETEDDDGANVSDLVGAPVSKGEADS